LRPHPHVGLRDGSRQHPGHARHLAEALFRHGTNPIANFPRRWNDAVGVRAGASNFFDAVAVFAGVGYDGNAIGNETLDPGLTDFHDASVAAGLRLKLVEQFAGMSAGGSGPALIADARSGRLPDNHLCAPCEHPSPATPRERGARGHRSIWESMI
jgi:hypothetical protein